MYKFVRTRHPPPPQGDDTGGDGLIQINKKGVGRLTADAFLRLTNLRFILKQSYINFTLIMK